MQGLDLEQLRTFVAVLDAGSLTAAAPRVFLSQSAVSEQIRKLEERAGAQLLVRSKAGVSATAAGQRLLAHAQRLIALADDALRDLRGEQLQGELRLAVTDYFRPGELATMLARLAHSHPRMRLNVSIHKSGQIDAMYARGEIDIGLGMNVLGGGAEPGVGQGRVLRRENLAWLASPAWAADRAAERAANRQARGDLRMSEPLPLLALPDDCALRQFTEQVLRKRRIDYRVAHVASGVAGLQAALAAGLGVACLNESAAMEGVVALPAPHGLPALPRVAFRLLPARAGEDALVAQVRDLLAQQLQA